MAKDDLSPIALPYIGGKASVADALTEGLTRNTDLVVSGGKRRFWTHDVIDLAKLVSGGDRAMIVNTLPRRKIGLLSAAEARRRGVDYSAFVDGIRTPNMMFALKDTAGVHWIVTDTWECPVDLETYSRSGYCDTHPTKKLRRR